MNSLRDAGYIILSIPMSEVNPLDLLEKVSGHNLQRLESPVYEFFSPGTGPATPPIKKNKELPGTIDTMEKLDLSIDSHLTLLQGLLKLVGSEVSASYSYDKTKKLLLNYKNAKCNTVSRVQLDAFLQKATLNTDAADTLSKLKNGDLYIVTETVHSKEFTIDESMDSQTRGEGRIEANNLGKLDTTVEKEKAKTNRMSYSGKKPLVFALKACRIIYDRPGFLSGKPTVFRLRTAENIIVVRGEEDIQVEELSTEEGIMSL